MSLSVRDGGMSKKFGGQTSEILSIPVSVLFSILAKMGWGAGLLSSAGPVFSTYVSMLLKVS